MIFLLGISCKNKWLNLRDQYRRVIKKNKNAANQGLKKRKWRFEDEMVFLQPYFREKNINPHSFHSNFQSTSSKETDFSDMTFEDGDDSNLGSLTVFEDVNETKTTEKDPIDAFFVAMAESVKTFPPLYQHLAKTKIFNAVSGIEIEILQGQDEGNDVQSVKLEN